MCPARVITSGVGQDGSRAAGRNGLPRMSRRSHTCSPYSSASVWFQAEAQDSAWLALLAAPAIFHATAPAAYLATSRVKCSNPIFFVSLAAASRAASPAHAAALALEYSAGSEGNGTRRQRGQG